MEGDVIAKVEEYIHKYSIEDWKSFFSQNFSSLSFSTVPKKLHFPFLYRGRLNTTKNGYEHFKYAHEMFAPPKTKSQKQRCNIKGQRILYTSSVPNTTLYELGSLNNGDEVTLIKYLINKETQIGPLGIVGVNQIMKINQIYFDIFKNHFKNASNNTVKMDELIASIFISQNSEEKPIYNLTNAITQIYLNNQKNVPKPELASPRFQGIVYPTVKLKFPAGVNVALLPSYAKAVLRPYICLKYRIIESSDGLYRIQLIEKTDIIKSDELKWRSAIGIIEEVKDEPFFE